MKITSIELAKSIYERAKQNNKTAWLSLKQSTWLFSLIHAEGYDVKCLLIGYVLPDGSWVKTLDIGDAIKIGQENIKVVKIKYLPRYIKNNNFSVPQIVLENLITI